MAFLVSGDRSAFGGVGATPAAVTTGVAAAYAATPSVMFIALTDEDT